MDSFKYLGITLDSTLSFDFHIRDIQKSSQQWLSAIRKLLYCSIRFYTMLSVSNQTKLTRITHLVSKFIGLPTSNLTELNNRSIRRFAISLEQDNTHQLNRYLIPLPSSCRYRTLKFRKTRMGKGKNPCSHSHPNNRSCWYSSSLSCLSPCPPKVMFVLYVVCDTSAFVC